MGPVWHGSARRLGSAADGQRPWVSSGGERQGAQSDRGATELVLPGPALRKAQGEAAGQGEEAPPEGLGGCHLLARADAPSLVGQIVGHDLDGQPATVGGEAARGQVIEPHAVLQSLPRT